MKRVLKCCSALMLTAMILMTTVGCGGTAVHFENGDFKFCSRTLGLYIEDLTAEGRQKRVLIVPEKIDGVPINGLWNSNYLWGGGPGWRSKNLEKLYLPKNFSVDSATFEGCDKLKSFFLLSYQEDGDSLNYVGEGVQAAYINNFSFKAHFENDRIVKPANVSYYYNDGRTENYGCYWIDNVPYGSVLDVLPPEDPVSEGKTFAGWYKEPECINAWNFETDTTPEEKVDEEGNVIYQETALYAKWV